MFTFSSYFCRKRTTLRWNFSLDIECVVSWVHLDSVLYDAFWACQWHFGCKRQDQSFRNFNNFPVFPRRKYYTVCIFTILRVWRTGSMKVMQPWRMYDPLHWMQGGRWQSGRHQPRKMRRRRGGKGGSHLVRFPFPPVFKFQVRRDPEAQKPG